MLEAFILLVRVEYQDWRPRKHMFCRWSRQLNQVASKRKTETHLIVRLAMRCSCVLMDAPQDDSFSSWLIDAIEVRLVFTGC